MWTIIRPAAVIFLAIYASACTYNPNGYANYRSYVYEGRPLYPESYESDIYYYKPYEYQERKQVKVPETYHVGAYRSPISHKDQDKTWVEGQNPQGYTIEIADKEKASEVAGQLQNVPKNERRAEVRYERDGKTYYRGLYGSYPNLEDAKKAMGTLPANVQEGANVKTWGSVQSSVNP